MIRTNVAAGLLTVATLVGIPACAASDQPSAATAAGDNFKIDDPHQ